MQTFTFYIIMKLLSLLWHILRCLHNCLFYLCIIIAGIYYSRDGGSIWTLSTGGYPTTGVSWGAIASSSSGQFVVVGSYPAIGNYYNKTIVILCILIINRLCNCVHIFTHIPYYCRNLGQLWTSINYGQYFAIAVTHGTNQYFQIGGLAMSSDGTKVIAAVRGLGKLR